MEVTALVVSGVVASDIVVMALIISVVGVVAGAVVVVVSIEMGGLPDPSSTFYSKTN